jgi:hypothetical protein
VRTVNERIKIIWIQTYHGLETVVLWTQNIVN